jgi:hypothetical protein
MGYARAFVEHHRSASCLVQKVRNAMPHDQGASMAWDKKEEAQGPHESRDKRNPQLREQRRSPETPAPRAVIKPIQAPLARVFGLRGQKHAEPPSVNLLLKRFA